ncbi:PAS domain S-box protein [Massilia sp. TS11]|uniref:PAS domain S-box protein n=1 Tax=Massilia sp. TS11 TaxID=2908003 RepID=UPI001EDACD53|nr:PAS domain S-box protein [Massilia sp. TS11]MCG2583355.1 PAS domain S-box protein [Massilia sp. TS11]
MTTNSPLLRHVRRLSRALLLPAFAAALLLAIWSAVAYQISVEREAAHHDAVARSQTLAQSLAEHVSHVLRQTEHAAQVYKLKFEESGGHMPLAEFTRRGGLLDNVLPARLDLPVALFDSAGRLTDSANGYPQRGAASEAWFQQLRMGGGDGAGAGAAVYEAATHKWQIQVARRLDGPDGSFAGAVMLLVDPAFFIDDYDRLNMEDDGALLLISPGSGLSTGRVRDRLFISDSVHFQHRLDPSLPVQELLPLRPLDSVARIYSAREIPRYGLEAVVGITEQLALERFMRHRAIYLWVTAAASVLIVTVTALLMDQNRRLAESVKLAQEAEAVLRAAAEGSLNGFMILKAVRRGRRIEDFVIAAINQRCADMIGQPRERLLGALASQGLPECRSTGLFDRYVQVVESGQALEEEFEASFTSLPRRWLHHQVVPLRDGVAITTRDVTARKRAEIEVLDQRSFLQSLIEHLPQLICVSSTRADSAGRLLVWNHAAEQITGHPAEQVLGGPSARYFPLPPDTPATRQLRDGLPVAEYEALPFTRRDGSQRFLHTLSVPLADEHAEHAYLLTIAEDITERRAQALALRASEAELAAIANASPLGLLRTDASGHCTYVNPTFETITGLARAAALGEGWLRAIHPEDLALLRQALAQLCDKAEPYQGVLRCQHPDGRIVWTSMKFAPVRINDATAGLVGTVDDITSLRGAEIALRESEARLRTIADTLPTMVAYIDADQTYRFYNSAYEREFGWKDQNMHGLSIRAVIGDAHYARIQPYIERVLQGETVHFEDVDVVDGEERYIDVNYIPQRDTDNARVIGFHVMRHDVSHVKREKNRLIKLAQVDPLTGLTNRAGFMLRLADAMQTSAAHGQLMAVMYMDIDRFKPVNDTYGHDVGDQLLKTFGARLTHALRATDTIARLGGDEFTVIMEKLTREEDARHIAAKIVQVMQQPFDLEGVRVAISASIGVAFYRSGELAPEALLKQADVHLYQAKQAGRNTFRSAA